MLSLRGLPDPMYIAGVFGRWIRMMEMQRHRQESHLTVKPAIDMSVQCVIVTATYRNEVLMVDEG
jgi:hypothetical protein